MSLGPTNNASSANQTRLTQTLRTQMEQTERLDRSKPADVQTLPSEQMEAQRVTASPEAQAESRATAKGSEDAIKARLQTITEANGYSTFIGEELPQVFSNCISPGAGN